MLEDLAKISLLLVVYVSDKYAHLIMRRSDSERRIITDPGGVSGGTFDLLALILTLMNRQKQRSSPRELPETESLRTKGKKVLRMLSNGSMISYGKSVVDDVEW